MTPIWLLLFGYVIGVAFTVLFCLLSLQSAMMDKTAQQRRQIDTRARFRVFANGRKQLILKPR